MRLFVAVMCLVSVALAPAVARGADAPQLIVWFAPADAPDSVLAARDALAARARKAGIAWLDLSPAAEPAPQAPALYRRAIEAYEALRYDDALAALDGAIDEVARTGAAGLIPAELSDLFLYRGLTYGQRGDDARAWDDLVRAAVIDPARVLDPLRFPTRAVEKFQKAKDKVAAQSRGALAVQAPAGCAVVIDAAPAPSGLTTLAWGEHYVRVECAGTRPWGARVTLASANQPVTPELSPLAAPELAALAALGHKRGARTIVTVIAQLGPDAAPVLSLALVDTATGKVRERKSVAIAPGGAATPDAEAALDQLLTPAAPVPVVPPPPPPAPRRWYRSPWLWAAVGAVAATAVILPLTLSGGEADDVTLEPVFTW